MELIFLRTNDNDSLFGCHKPEYSEEIRLKSLILRQFIFLLF